MTWRTDEQTATLHGAMCRVVREGRAYRVTVALSVGAVVLRGEAVATSEDEARSLCERLAMGLGEVSV